MAELGWGIVGCGDVANKLVAPAIGLARDSRLVCFLSSDLGRAEDYAARHGASRAYDSMARFLADPELDAVFVASRHNEHLPHTIAAAQAGKHVLCEKPMGLNEAECQRMLDVCRRNGVNLAIAYRQRFYSKNQKVKELLDAGSIGRVIFVQAGLAHDYNPTPDDPKYWRTNPAVSGGGPMVDGGAHLIDLLCLWLGEPAAVVALTDNVLRRHQADDADVVLMRMKSGVQVSASFHSNVSAGLNRTEIFGTGGTIVTALGTGPQLTLRKKGDVQEFDLPVTGNADVPMIEDFAVAALTGRPPRYTGEDGAVTTRITDAAFESARTGVWVSLDQSPMVPAAVN